MRPQNIATKIITLTGLVLLLASQATAQRAVTVGPLNIEREAINPGETFEETVRINNAMEIARPAHVGFYDIDLFGEEGRFNVIDETKIDQQDVDPRVSMKTWVSLESSQITLPPAKEQRWKEVKVTVSVPKDAMPGAHYGVLLITPDTSVDPKDMESSGMVLQQRQGVAFVINVAGDTKEEGNLLTFSAEKGFYEYGPVQLQTRIQNSGTTYLKPKGKIYIKNMFGFTTDTIDFNQLDKRALPNLVRRFDDPWTNMFLTTDKDKGLQLNWDKLGSFRLGLYTAVLDITYGQNDTPITASTSFWIIPWKLLLVLFLGIALIIGIILLLYNLMKKRAIEGFKKQIEQEHLHTHQTLQPNMHQNNPQHPHHYTHHNQHPHQQ